MSTYRMEDPYKQYFLEYFFVVIHFERVSTWNSLWRLPQ